MTPRTPTAAAVQVSGAPAFRVRSLVLTDFRTYARLKLDLDGAGGLVVLTGPNGSGKTNVLEALSYLGPGRGLRAARVVEPTRWGAEPAAPGMRPAWAVAATVDGPAGARHLGTGLDPDPTAPERRLIHVDGASARAQGRLAGACAVQWLTPPMERLFQDGAAGRRKFIDRVAYGLDAQHAGRVQAYEQTVRERARLLAFEPAQRDRAWIETLEAQLAESGVAIACARTDAAGRLDAACRDSRGPFPGARVAMTGAVEDWLAEMPALAAEDRLRRALVAARERDALIGGAGAGPHKSDLAVVHAPKDQPAEACSTGEQKALLIALVLGAADLIREAQGARPILLLDEVAAHLDRVRREALFASLLDSGTQAWLAGADREPFAALRGTARFFAVADGAMEPLP
ncbi:MAG: DNA replication/repair protein RecF [Pseudomonadota bacterium]